ncbi:MAG: thiosulfate oxidation carrier protein SoxY [Armatimonadota bacterium]|nr:thiosulfate oxidation carrier protein SoxY [Armatimonadota bacterium]MDR7475905.1 thiosulfate oxidation carrier protein SoxY [Armatimonadota bacterium]
MSEAAFPSAVRLVEPPGRPGLEREHLVSVRLPATADDGANVPIVVEMDHPMEPDHYIKSLAVYAFEDPLVNKGIFSFTPQNGQVYLAFQFRMTAGEHRVFVVAECTRHGKWATSRRLWVSTGGCHTVGLRPGELQEPAGAVGQPRVWVPERIRRGEIFEVRVKAKHPSRTGLTLAEDGRSFVRAGPAVYLRSLDVFYGRSWFRPRLVSSFALTSVLSDDPLFVFRLRADQDGRLWVVLTNHEGKRFEASRAIRLG